MRARIACPLERVGQHRRGHPRDRRARRREIAISLAGFGARRCHGQLAERAPHLISLGGRLERATRALGTTHAKGESGMQVGALGGGVAAVVAPREAQAAARMQ